MNVIRFVSFVLMIPVVLGLSACGSPMIGQPGYGSLPVQYQYSSQGYQVETIPLRYYVATRNPDRTWTVNMGSSAVLGTTMPEGQAIAYLGHNKLWVINGQVQPPRLVVMSHVPNGFGGIQHAAFGPQTGLIGSPLSGISAETATMLLRELEAGGNPCTSRSHNSSLTVGGVIGGMVGLILTRDIRGLAFGGLLGAAGGSEHAQWNCSAYTSMRISLLATIDAAKARCRDALQQREVDGQLTTTKTRDCAATEARDFDRIGQGGQPAARTLAPIPAPRQRVVRPEEEKPPK